MDLDTLGQQELDALGAVELRALAAQLIERAQADRAAMVWRDARIAQLTAEMATVTSRHIPATLISA